MTMTQDSGGGGTAANLCPPSPSDLAGQINNLITRIENLEKAVAELQGQDVTATQLSDLSQQVGWVYDVTYLGVPGWTQTAAGTLIPPAGLALSTLGIVLPGLGGNPSTLVSTDSDGNPTFSINNSGTTGGGGGGSMKSATFANYTSGADTLVGGSYEVLTIDTIHQDTIGGISLGSNIITGVTQGWYHASGMIFINGSAKSTHYEHIMQINGVDLDVINRFEILELGIGEGITDTPYFSFAGSTYISTGASLKIEIFTTSTGSTLSATVQNLCLIQLDTTSAGPA